MMPAVPADLSTIADPRFILLAWASGLSLAAGIVSSMRVVGVGFTWLAAGVAGLVGLAGALADGALWARIGFVALILGVVSARRQMLSGVFLLGAGLAFLLEAAMLGGWLPGLTAAMALGGVTGEMMLGHWYLIDPRLPRWSLRALAIGGIVGLAVDGLLLASTGELPGGGATVAFWLLLATSIVLMAAVIGALRYPAYSGVMAATGLSYLAVLTSLGAVFLGRALIAGVGPFA